MNRSHLYRLLIVVFVVGWSFFEIYPPNNRDLLVVFQELAGRKDATFSNIVERAQSLQKERPDNAFGNLKDAVGTNELSKYFSDIDVKAERDPNAAILYYVQREAAGRIKLGLDLQGGVSFLVTMDTNRLASGTMRDTALSHAVEVLRKRVDALGVAEPLLQPEGNDRILIQLPGLSESVMDQARRTIQQAAYLTINMVNPESDKLVSEGIVEPGYTNLIEIREDNNGRKTSTIVQVKKEPEQGLTGKYIKRARVGRDQYTNRPEILFELDSEGAKIFGDVTTKYKPIDTPTGKKYFRMAIVLDGELQSAPQINEPIPGGNVRITGNFSEKDAFSLATALENPLEAPVAIMQENTVDPSLGKDSIRSGITASIVGTAAVSLFMLVYYMLSGMVANIALVTNIIILLGVMCSLGTTLTLPGIAGIVLTVGMAVDANVLIYERIREESGKGKSLRGALAAGYDRAFGTIFDSHVTTLISSLILVWMGTGSIKGFGVALTIGVAASLFTALVVTRLIFDFVLARGWISSLPMLHIIRAAKLNFMKLAVPAFIASWTLSIVGTGYGIHRGLDAFGVDFLGGDSITLTYTKKVEVDQLRSVISKLGVGDVTIQYQKDPGTRKENLRVTLRELGDAKKGAVMADSAHKVVDELKAKFKDANFVDVGVEHVGAVVGKEIMRTAIVAALLSLFGILVYVAFRYEFSFAVGAVIAVVHDVLMTIGWYCLSGREFNATTVAAILTIIGFSTNDTIVIFDRIREDLRMGVRGTFRELINQALNQTLSRTIITSGTVFLATMSLYLFGGGAINDFAFTFLVGIITGTYSSIYIASSLVLWWHKGQRPKLGAQVMVESTTAALSTAKV